MLHRSKETTINVYLKLIDSLIKSIILFALGRTPLNINIEIQMLKYLNDLLSWKRADTILGFSRRKSSWVKYMKTQLEVLGLGNVMGKIYKVISWEILKEK